MDMTFDQYIANPLGKTNAVMNASTRELIRKDYIKRFDNVLLKENGKIEYHLYTDKKSNNYWVHIKVPSEVVHNFYYDVVLKFYTNQAVDSAGEDLFKYYVKFYSNDPSFVYTYAHVFFKNGLFIKELASKMSKEALKKAPNVTNPTKSVGYVKALYFAYLIMKNRNLNKKIKFKAEASALNISSLIAQIEDADIKIRKRQEEDKKLNKKKKVQLDEKTAQRLINASSGKLSASETRIQVATTKKIGSIKKVNSIKTVNRAKRI